MEQEQLDYSTLYKATEHLKAEMTRTGSTSAFQTLPKGWLEAIKD